MNPNYTDFRFPQIKTHPWHKAAAPAPRLDRSPHPQRRATLPPHSARRPRSAAAPAQAQRDGYQRSAPRKRRRQAEVEVAERFAYAGVSLNLITYLTGPLESPQPRCSMFCVFEVERPGCKLSLQQRIGTYFYKPPYLICTETIGNLAILLITNIVPSIEKLQEIQDELEKVNEEASDKVLEVEQKYNEIRRPVYRKRNEIIQSIPDFWLTAVCNFIKLMLMYFT